MCSGKTYDIHQFSIVWWNPLIIFSFSSTNSIFMFLILLSNLWFYCDIFYSVCLLCNDSSTFPELMEYFFSILISDLFLTFFSLQFSLQGGFNLLSPISLMISPIFFFHVMASFPWAFFSLVGVIFFISMYQWHWRFWLCTLTQ